MKKILTVLVLITIYSCESSDLNSLSSDSDLATVINEPFEGDFINDTIFNINPSIDNVLEMSNGSSVVIPANSLVNDNDEIVKEEVAVTFKQYHSILDVISSGIPMSYDTLGESHTFETAGMFSLKAKDKKGQSLSIKENNEIQVNLGSDKDGDFNFYELNEQTGEWTYQNKEQKLTVNDRCNLSKTPIRPTKGNDDAFVLDLDFDLSNYSELQIFSSVVWEYTGDHDSLDPRINKIGKVNWTDFNLEPTYEQAYEYYLTMSKRRKSFVTKVKASLNGEDLDLALNEFKNKKVELQKEIDRLQKPFIRSVNISGFGTFNTDCVYLMAKPTQVIADFEFNDKGDKEHALIVIVYEKKDIIMNCPRSYWPKLNIDTESTPKIIAILPDNKIAVFNGDVTKSYNKASYTFQMDVLDEKITSKADLLAIIQNI